MKKSTYSVVDEKHISSQGLFRGKYRGSSRMSQRESRDLESSLCTRAGHPTHRHILAGCANNSCLQGTPVLNILTC